MRTCPYCAETIPDESSTCPFCATNLIAPNVMSPAVPVSSQPQTSGKAIASLICGLFFFVLPASIVAVIMGHLSLSEIRRGAGRLRGRGLAIAGLIFGYLGLSFIPMLIIAAIAIPNLLRSKMAANEASAVGMLRSYNYAVGAYAAKCPKIGFPASLANLGPGVGEPCNRANLLDRSLGAETPIKYGYAFHYVPGDVDRPGQIISFALTADPSTPGTTGSRHFYVDQTGIIRCNTSGPATADSPPL